MRNFQQRLSSHIFMFGTVVLLAAGCAWDGNEMPTKTADMRSAAPQDTNERMEGMEVYRMFESEKMKAVVAELPAQF